MQATPVAVETLLQKLRPYGQEHVLAFWEECSAEEQSRLARQISDIDLELLAHLFSGEGLFDPRSLPLDRLQVPDVWQLGRDGPGVSRFEAAREGERLIRAGKVACLLVAGGQGTRLGFPGPKGTMPFGPVSGKTLFAIHAAKIASLEARFRTRIPLLVMTSLANDEVTRRYFDLNGHFDLAEVRFIMQGSLPGLDDRGKLFLEARDRIFISPDGHGGTIAALVTSGLLAELMDRGFTDLFYFQVDNPLVKIAEPFFLGAHSLLGSEYSIKVLRRRTPREKLGLLARSGDRHVMVEYSDLPADIAQARDPRGELLFWAGSPAIHIFSLAFFARLAKEGVSLPYHRARKAIPHLDHTGRCVRPIEPNGAKFEAFIFDSLPFARKILAVEGVREEEFAPVKNAAGEDSIDTARRMLIELHWRWLASRGVEIPRDAQGAVALPCEIHPSFALGPEDIPEDIARKVRTDRPVYLE